MTMKHFFLIALIAAGFGLIFHSQYDLMKCSRSNQEDLETTLEEKIEETQKLQKENEILSGQLTKAQGKLRRAQVKLEKIVKDIKVADLYESDKMMQISRKHEIFFVHIPKSGGSSIESSRLFADKPNTRAAGHAHVSAFLSRPLTSMYQSFAIVRHPCERFLSAFNYLQLGGRNGMDKKWARDNIGNLTLDEWVQRGIRDTYFHLEPMWQYTFTKEDNHTTMGVDKIFCQERFSEATDWVNSLLDLRVFDTVPHVNKGISHEGCMEIKDETRQAIERFYTLDYCIFGYDRGPGMASKPDICNAQGFSKEEFTDRYAQCAEQYSGDKQTISDLRL
mmetsp:Transcript_18645/g.32055  ORF Transcript_18645/g.32055 Transcript_18645/m.32055 type:complete len:335 (-) Transcript_18645:4-1008(-)